MVLQTYFIILIPFITLESCLDKVMSTFQTKPLHAMSVIDGSALYQQSDLDADQSLSSFEIEKYTSEIR